MENALYVASRQEFQEIIVESVDELLLRRIPEIIRQANSKEYLTSKELKDLTGFSYRTQKYHRDKGNLTFINEGRRFLYPVNEIERFMRERMIEAKKG